MCPPSWRPGSHARPSASRERRRRSTASATATSGSTRTGGSFVLKVGNPADAAGTVEMQVLAMEHALTADPELPIARPRRTVDGRPTGSVAIDGVDHAVQLVALIDGISLPPGPASPTTRRSIGAAVARLDQALAGFSHPLAHRALLWDVARLPRARRQARVPRARPPRARRALPRTLRRRRRALTRASSRCRRSTATSTPAMSSSAGTTRSASPASSTSATSSERER